MVSDKNGRKKIKISLICIEVKKYYYSMKNKHYSAACLL